MFGLTLGVVVAARDVPSALNSAGQNVRNQYARLAHGRAEGWRFAVWLTPLLVLCLSRAASPENSCHQPGCPHPARYMSALKAPDTPTRAHNHTIWNETVKGTISTCFIMSNLLIYMALRTNINRMNSHSSGDCSVSRKRAVHKGFAGLNQVGIGDHRPDSENPHPPGRW